MSKFKIVIIGIILIIVGVVIYSYNQIPSETSNQKDVTNNSSTISNKSTLINGPKIEVGPQFYDLGDVVYGDIAKHTFTVKNIGDKPLEILRLSTSCGCTSAEIAEEDKVIKPGEVVDMIVAFDPAVMNDPTATGSVERVVYIKTNDPDQPEFEVDVIANVINSQK